MFVSATLNMLPSVIVMWAAVKVCQMALVCHYSVVITVVIVNVTVAIITRIKTMITYLKRGSS